MKLGKIEELQDASDSILSKMSEGFEQPTDRAFARFLYVSKASTAEVRTRLARAQKRGLLGRTELVLFKSKGTRWLE
jgi:four helix bundle protein